jgi:uncharacterized protein
MKFLKAIPLKSPSKDQTKGRLALILRLSLFFALLLLVSLYITVSVILANSLLKSPVRWVAETTPAAFGLKYSEVSFPAAVDNLAVKGWFVPAPVQSDKIILVLHGKGQNRGSYLDFGAVLAKNGYNVLLIDFRGHGETAGANYTFGYYEQRDVAGALNYLKQQGFKGSQTGLVGYSLGAVAGLLAFKRADAQAMVSDSAFASLPDRLDLALSKRIKPPLEPLILPGIELAASFLSGLDVNAVNPAAAVKDLKGRHLLLIHGDQDQTAPVNDVRQLKAAAGDNAEMWIVPGAGHTLAFKTAPRQYTERVVAFFRRELK